jgi:hypothetical protein
MTDYFDFKYISLNEIENLENTFEFDEIKRFDFTELPFLCLQVHPV